MSDVDTERKPQGEHRQTLTRVVVDTSHSPHAHLKPVPLDRIRLNDVFWAPRRRINHERTLPSQFHHLESTGRLDNFRRASGKKDAPFEGLYFNDSDVYKWLEAASWALATQDDEELRRMVDTAITEVADAQRTDGYLNTYFALDRADERWTDFDLHEMYCAGHLFQAAVAHHRATGTTRLLDVATRFADHICDTFGSEEGKRTAVDGHEEVELGLVELYRATRTRRYLDQAKFFVEARGHGRLGRPYGRFDPEYSQDHKPFRALDAVVGHAVRALYYNAGVADVYAELDDDGYKTALERLWHNMTSRRMYVTGGIGSRYEGEAFGKDYELPHDRAYTETCAAIASVMWNWRMLALEGEARYSDLMEWTLYNAVLPGLSLDGEYYFYQNPLADDGTHRRQPWFGCACCPPNIARLLASLPGYFYSVSDEGLWVHLYATGEVDTILPGGQRVSLVQNTQYPWHETVTLRLHAAGHYGLMLRIPSWCEEGASVTVNGERCPQEIRSGTYARLARTWEVGDTVQLNLPMPVRYIEAHPYVFEAAGRAALARGPILYCVEGVDHPGLDVRDLTLPEDPSQVKVEPPGHLGEPILTARATVRPAVGSYLYRTMTEYQPVVEPTRLTAVPYFSWANREPSPMQVWLRLP
jgi:DUF1680 family protein